MRVTPSLAILLAGLAVRVWGQGGLAPGQLRIATKPDGAMVSVNGTMENPTPVTVQNVKPGQHLIVAVKPGYREARRSVVVEQGKTVYVEIPLEPLTGLLLVHSVPPGAEIQIDGADRGKTPALIVDLPTGRHRLRASSPGYMAKEVDLNVPDRTPQKVTVDLTSNSAILSLDSAPPGAKVLLNGIARGVTPCEVDRIPAGDAIVEMQLDGYEPFRQNLRLSAGQKDAVNATLLPLPASLTVVSMPEGARIYVGNQFRGEAPITLEKLEPGAYRVRAELAGYAALARDVTLERAQKLTEEFRMLRNCGVFEITTEPAGGTVFLDGENKGVTVAKANATDNISETLRVDLVTIGAHNVQITKPGYFDVKFAIEIEKDKTVTMHQKLQKRFIPDIEVRTKVDVIRGVLLEVDPVGNVKLETRPGITRTIPAAEVVSRRPIRQEPSN
jgi:hypothetical protein